MKSFKVLIAMMVVIASLGAGEEDKYTEVRILMVDEQIRARGVSDPRVLEAMLKVPRHIFVDPFYAERAYGDYPLPIGEGQTISQPYIVALMTEALNLKPGDRVLEIGTGSGYQAAVLAELVKEVYTVEIREGLAASARGRLKRLGYRNIDIKHADGYYGWTEHAPFDAIMITASPNHIPPPLIRQLKEGGRMILPLGSTAFYQVLTLCTKTKGELRLRQLASVSFVPMVGRAKE